MPSLDGANVLVIGINYSPEPTGIAPYTTGVAEQLAGQAADVTVLTGLPHYPAWSVPTVYRRRRTEEPRTPGRPNVIRLAHYVPTRQTAIRRAFYELTFLLHVLWAARRLPTRVDLIVCATPSLGGAVAAARIARRLDVPLITVVQDLMAKATGQSGIKGGGSVTAITARLERYALTHATRVAVVADAFRPAVAQYGVDDDRIALLPNWTHVHPSTISRAEARERLGWQQDQFVVAHTGNIGLKQDLGTVVEAGRLLASADDLTLLIIGDGSQRAAIAEQAHHVDTVGLLPPLDDTDYPLALAAADLLLVNERASVGDMSLPSKLTSYLAAGRPVLAAVSADGATAAELAASDGAGLVIPPGDPASLATAILRLRDDSAARDQMSSAALAYAQNRLGAERSMWALADMVSTALPPTARALRRFTPEGYDKGRGKVWQLAWFVTMNLVFSAWWCPARFRPAILRAFGAQVGKRVLIRHRVRVLWPWKLSIGDDCWIGEDAWLLNLEPITIEHDVCLSQGAFLCTGSHDHRDRSFRYDNAPIHIGAGAWVAARATVLRGSLVPAAAVVGASEVFRPRSHSTV
jgi:acetyltransferase-like isoleucine patch superfamily enzyme/glycosyltransferase involved in cell wall biosynthesis